MTIETSVEGEGRGVFMVAMVKRWGDLLKRIAAVKRVIVGGGAT